ncbi:MAG: gamma-glutamyltransferase [Acidobacteria bacterium]|nr:gamma-glutamyltransferase [Acidobacteriota bacterium]
MRARPKTGLIIAVLGFVAIVPAARGAAFAENAAVSSPERLATTAGLNILRQGGTAADAAVAIAFSLTVLRPDSAGLLGGGTALYFDATSGEMWALDFTQRTPNATYVEGGVPENAISLAVPGLTRGLRELQRKFGSSSWSSLLQPALALAEEKVVSDRMREVFEAETVIRTIDPMSSETESELSKILSRIAERGADELYVGETSRQLVARSRSAGGTITARSLTEYAPRWRSPIRLDFRGDQIFTVAAPTGAGAVLADTVTLLAGFDWSGRSASDAGTIHLFVEAERHGWSKAGRAVSDRGAVSHQLVSSPEELTKTRRQIENPPLEEARIDDPRHSSVGFVVLDEKGNAAVVSLSLGPPFGSGKLFGNVGYIAATPDENRNDPMLPLLVLRQGRVGLLINASGRGREAAIGGGLYLRSKLLGTGLEELIAMSRFLPAAEPRTIMCETGTDLEIVDRLNAMGHGVEWDKVLGTIHAIEADDRIALISDPRGGTAGGY